MVVLKTFTKFTEKICSGVLFWVTTEDLIGEGEVDTCRNSHNGWTLHTDFVKKSIGHDRHNLHPVGYHVQSRKTH